MQYLPHIYMYKTRYGERQNGNYLLAEISGRTARDEEDRNNQTDHGKRA